ncbi:MAG: hypothetical protein N3G19_00875 [Candidatus Pacearchaeota archaeon]|nr:hypothetical protein [Candidatus Pacearchaeota archaeon]
MSFQDSLKKLKASKEFKKFKNKFKNSFLFSAFFILGPSLEIETQQFDYFLTKKKAATFTVNDKIELKTDNFNPKDKVTALDENIEIDIDKLKEIIKKEITKRNLIDFDINKIIMILQKIDGKQLWNITCMLSSLKLLKLHVDCFNGKVLKNEEANVFDFLQIKSNKK